MISNLFTFIVITYLFTFMVITYIFFLTHSEDGVCWSCPEAPREEIA